MAIDQVDRRVVSERPTVTSREAARGDVAHPVDRSDRGAAELLDDQHAGKIHELP